MSAFIQPSQYRNGRAVNPALSLHPSAQEPVIRSARLYLCARCYRQVSICSHCDRGNVYCAGVCAQTARQEKMRCAGRRYQAGYPGRRTNAARQNRFRARQQQIVTHQGSRPATPHDVLPTEPSPSVARRKSGPVVAQYAQHCCYCSVICSPFLRRRFLRYCP